MPTKTVRWSGSNELFQSSPTHSPTSSPSSSLSGSLELTPPFPIEIRISEKLRFQQNIEIDFVNDLLNDPTEGILDSESGDADELATEPSVSNLVVISSKLPVTIRIDEDKEEMGITVCALLRQLFMALHEQVATEELESARPEVRENILKAFARRCDNLAEHSVARAVQQQEAGPRKIDYLEGFSKLAGFEVVPSDHGDLTLRLHVR